MTRAHTNVVGHQETAQTGPAKPAIARPLRGDLARCASIQVTAFLLTTWPGAWHTLCGYTCGAKLQATKPPKLGTSLAGRRWLVLAGCWGTLVTGGGDTATAHCTWRTRVVLQLGEGLHNLLAVGPLLRLKGQAPLDEFLHF